MRETCKSHVPIFPLMLRDHERRHNLINLICYSPQRSWDKVIFSEACVKNSVHGGRRSPGPHPGEVCILACTEADPPNSRRLLLRAVRILLECILVTIMFHIKSCNTEYLAKSWSFKYFTVFCYFGWMKIFASCLVHENIVLFHKKKCF